MRDLSLHLLDLAQNSITAGASLVTIRLTLGEDITEEEVDYMIKSVKEVVEYLRSFSPVWRDLMAGKTPFIL